MDGQLRRAQIVVASLLLAAVPAFVQDQDRRQPNIQFVEVEPGVRLEVVDWGGKRRPLVLLSGLGETAHVYHQFATKLAETNRVYGITRRGFGASSVPRSGYNAARLAEDVASVLEVLKLEGAVLVGHSVAGEELTAAGGRHPERIAGLVYLDAASDRTYSTPPEMQERAKRMGFLAMPKAVAGQFDPRVEVRNGVQKPDYSRIRVPALAIYPSTRTWQEYAPGSPPITDPETIALASQVVADIAAVRKRMSDEFLAGVRNSRVVYIPAAGHYVFRTNEADVLREIRRFLDSLP
ncbi:MAG: alpha/beta hydrolase [Acidobacteria bacterium]|nr:alpha/beta hydrolase [Acidobacteriota bacterium]